jgi:hypothetical protein
VRRLSVGDDNCEHKQTCCLLHFATQGHNRRKTATQSLRSDRAVRRIAGLPAEVVKLLLLPLQPTATSSIWSVLATVPKVIYCS